MSKMTNQESIDEIKSRLTTDVEENKKYLKEQLQKYRSEKNGQVAFAVTQLLFSYLTKEERAKYDKIAFEIIQFRKNQFQESNKLIKEGKLEEAKRIILNLVQSYEKLERVRDKIYFDFEQLMEYIIYCKTVKRSQQLDIHRYPEPIAYFYYQLGCIEVEQEDTLEAITYFTKALKYNPRGLYLYEELVKLYLKQEDYDKAFSLSKEALEYAYKKEQFAFFYKALGMCYKVMQKYDISIASFVVSDHFAGEAFNKNEIAEIIKVAGYIKFEKPEDILQLFAKEQINYGPSRQLIETVNDFISYFKFTKNYPSLEYVLKVMVELTDSDYYQKQLKELEDLKNEKK